MSGPFRAGPDPAPQKECAACAARRDTTRRKALAVVAVCTPIMLVIFGVSGSVYAVQHGYEYIGWASGVSLVVGGIAAAATLDMTK